MKLLFFFFVLLAEADAESLSCQQKHITFVQNEESYDVVVSVAVAGPEAYKMIGTFIESSGYLLSKCSNTLTLDKQYTLKRKLNKARHLQPSYKVYTQAQLKDYAISHPEEIVVYKWGTIRPVQ